jgi:DNA helicase-2/ATP-dependent DNA helicase PcrA
VNGERSELTASGESAGEGHAGEAPPVVAEELSLLRVVLGKLDSAQRKPKIQVDDASALIELRDALAEAKPEDQGALLEQMHRIEALSRQRGKGDSPPVDRRSPYFGHMRLLESGRRRDVLIGQRGYVEPGGGVQIVDWRNAPVSRLFYRYEEGDNYEEQLGDRMVEGEVVARRTVAIVNAELRRVASTGATYARDQRTGGWREIATKQSKLTVGRDGSVTVNAAGPAASAAVKGDARTARLGLEGNGQRRLDRFLPAIAALIDPRQFELISRPTSGLIVVQGSAGSGKTTIGLHRIAYLAFADPRRFRPERMLVVVYQRALATYVSHVLPSLDVPGVPVLTFSAWSQSVRKAVFPSLDVEVTDATPSLVLRAKSHGAMLKILADRQAEIAAWCRAELAAALADKPDASGALEIWDASSGPVDLRVSTLARWTKEAPLAAASRTALETAGHKLRARTRDVIGEWAALFTDRQALGEGFARHAPGLFSETQLDAIHRWGVDRDRLRTGAADQDEDDEKYALDPDDDALLLRIYQMQKGPLSSGKGPIAYEHLMVDEVQDFAPLELAVLLDSTTKERSITLAGDTAQAIAPEHGFSSWTEMLDDLGIAHDRVEPLRVSYRSTREIVDCALHVLGPLSGDVRPVAPRSGAPVESFGFASAGEASEFLAQSLKELVRSEPLASVALIARHPEQARLYYDALAAAEVPSLRLVAAQDFPFRPGIDVTDVRQTKGLEFDIVVLLEVTENSYAEDEHARRLLHVAMTRSAHQLWVTYTGTPSPLLPDSLR